MNLEHYKQLLLAKEKDLAPDVSRLQTESRSPDGMDVGDAVDLANMEVQRTEFSEEAAVFTDTLTQVRDALARIDDRSYGKCAVCGRDINPARLEAVPWTPYCIEDQEKQDEERQEQRVEGLAGTA